MYASQLVARLQRMIEEHGDQKVVHQIGDDQFTELEDNPLCGYFNTVDQFSIGRFHTKQESEFRKVQHKDNAFNLG